MLILGGITISIVFNEDGVISKAQEAKEKTEIAQLQERLELAKLSAYINEEYKFNLDDYFQSLEDEGIIGNKEEDIVDNGDGTYEITTDDGYIFEITVKPDKENPEEVEIEYSGKVDGPRIRKINATRVNDSTITVEVEALNAEGATYTYSYKKDGETEWVEASTGNSSNTYRFEDLDVNAGYSIKVKVEKEGKSVEKETKVAAPGAIPGGDEALTEGTITVGEEQWSNGQASIEVSTNTGLQIEYQINATIEGNWETPTQGKITGLRDGDKVNIRLTNGTRYGEPVTITISDEKAPEKATIRLTSTSVIIGETLTATVTHTDNESGVDIANSKWVMTTSEAEIGTAEGDISKYTGSFTTNGETLTLNSSTAGTYYLHVLTVDNAGNKTETVSEAITIGALAGTVTQNGEITWSAGQASIVLQSSESQYQIVYKVNGEGDWKEYNGTSITGLKHGDSVTACLTNEGQTTYGPEATFEIQDTTAPIITEVSSNTTTNSVTLTVNAVDNEAGLPETLNYKFEIKETSAEDSEYEEIQTGANATATKSGLTQGTSYTIRVTLQDKAGNTGTYTKELTTETVGGASEGLEEGNIVATDPQWSNGQASITLSTTTGLQIQYQTNSIAEGSWKTGTTGVQVTGLKHGDTVYARLWDGTNAGDHSSVSITDNIAPTKATIAPNTTSLLIGETLTATVTHTDNESGVDIGNSKWVMTTSSAEIGTAEENISQYTGSFTTNGASITLDNTKAGTYYLHVLTVDNAENKTETVSEAITISGITGTVTQSGNITWSEGQATLKLQASDNNYQIVYKVNEEESWQEYNGTSIQGLNHGDKVTACLTNEGQTTYGPEATFEIQDNIAPTKATIAPNTTNLLIGETLTATVTHTDNESGVDIGNSKWVMTTSSAEIGTEEGNISKYTGNFTTNGASITLDNTKAGTYYLHVLTVDNAENKTETVSEAITISGITGTVTQSGNITWSEGQATLKLQASDNNYQIVYKVNGEESWEEYNGTSIQGLNHGDTVTACLTNEGQTTYGPEATFTIQDTTNPTVTVTALGSPSTNSIAVTVQVRDDESGMKENPTYTYYIKQSGQGEESYITPSGASNITNAQYTFTGLTQTTSYDIKVEVNGDKAGNKGTGTLENQKTDTVPGASVGLETGNIIASPAVWQNGKASITLSTTTNYQMQYQKNNTTEGSWSEGANSPITVGDLNHGDTVYARLWDGTNAGSDSSVSIEDNIASNQAGIILSNTNVTTGTQVTATVTHIDNESGVDIGKSKYVWNTTSGKIGTSANLYTGGTFSSNGEQISQTMSSPGTYYLHVLTVDKGENATETVSEAITVRQLVTGISLNQTSATITEGETLQLTATITPENASNKSVKWESNDAGVASVSTSGLVTANTAGTATITATAQDGSNKTATCSITVNKKVTNINELEAGDYVNYEDGTGVTRKCVVLYDSSSPYGVEIITMETVEQVILGDSRSFTKAMNSYNNAISTLNNATSKYINTTYVDKARSVGSDPSNPTSDNPGYFTSSYSYMSSYNGKFKNTDTHYETDLDQMEALTIHDIDKSYALASRYVVSSSDRTWFYVRGVNPSGSLKSTTLCYVDDSVDSNGCYGFYFGLRPIFHLRSNIKVTGGTGEEGSPYTLGT